MKTTVLEQAQMAETALLGAVFNDGKPLVLVVSPPGAGKTRLVESLVAVAVQHFHWTVGVAAPRAEQAYDIVRRLVSNYEPMPLQLLHSKDRLLPRDLSANPQVRAVTKPGDLLPHEGVVIGTVDKFMFAAPGHSFRYDLLICDEAFQVTYAKFSPLTLLAEQIVLVGDPGQLPPLVQSDTSRLEGAPYRVHWPVPKELLRRWPDVTVVPLPVTRRLPQDTVNFIQPAFYPDLAFSSANSNAGLRLQLKPGNSTDPIDRALDLISQDRSLVALVAPFREIVPGQVDGELAGFQAQLIQRFFERAAEWSDSGRISSNDIGCGDPHVASGEAVRQELRRLRVPTDSDGVMVDTPEIWQGLQRRLMIIKHPLSGARTLSGFSLEPGRFCVLLSRHQFGCIIVTRDGILDALAGHRHDSAERPAGSENVQWSGWLAHRQLWTALLNEERIVRT